MKTTESSHETRVILKDGATYLGTWSQDFDTAPTVGDKVAFPSHVGRLEHLQAFRSGGRVTKVQKGKGLRESFIEIEAEPMKGFRRSVTLNSGFIPRERRMDAERQVRQSFPDSRVIWEESMEPSAVLRISDTKNLPAGTLEDAQRSRGETLAGKDSRSAWGTLESQLREMLMHSREVLAHF
jgi:hypothetical protein